MKKILGILVLLFVMVCGTAGAARPVYFSSVYDTTWLQVRDRAIEVKDKEGILLKIQYPDFTSKDGSHGAVISTLKKETDELVSFFDKDIRETKMLAAEGNRGVRDNRWQVFVEVIRDDDRLFSMLERSFHRDLAGERWGFAGRNYDVKTGKRLRCLDVFNLTKEELVDTLAERLEANYGREVLGDNPKQLIRSDIEGVEDQDFLPWVFTDKGVDFYFTTGNFKDGDKLLLTSINFREEPQLFNLKYRLSY